MGKRDDPSVELDTAAYTALKAEQSSRISLRDNYSLTYLATIATLFFGYFTTKDPVILLAIPAATFIGMHAYATNDHRISEIRSFLKRRLPASLAREWEDSHHQASAMIRLRAALRIIAGLLLFAGPAIVSLAVISSVKTTSLVRLGAISATCISLGLMLVTYFVLAASSRDSTTTATRG